jgi:hypothetical protein
MPPGGDSGRPHPSSSNESAEAVLTIHTDESAEDTRLCLHAYSRRRGQIAPVVQVLTAADAAALAQAVLDAALLAYGACSVEDPLVVQDAVCHTCGAGWHDVYPYNGSVVQYG